MRQVILNARVYAKQKVNLRWPYVYFTVRHIVKEYWLILQNKNLAYTESIENSRLNYISKMRGDWGWV